MTKIPDITGSTAVKALQKAGWAIKSQRGSHIKLTRTGVNHFLIVPMHGKKTIPKGTLSNIIKDAEMTVDDFVELL